MEKEQEITVYTISDSVGETSQKVLSAVAVQYPELHFNNIYRFPFVNNEVELLEILGDALKDKAIVISTLVNQSLLEVAQNFSLKTGLLYHDLMSPLFKLIYTRNGVKPIEQAGITHKLDTEYFNRIAAIEFAVKYDDGKNPQGFLESDIVILGVSRTSKTPLSMYLANKGYKVSNLPLIVDTPLPKILKDVDSNKIIGLTCRAENLAKVRESRLDSLGLDQSTNYTNYEKIETELNYAKQVFNEFGAHIIDVTDKSVEEVAYVVENHFKKMK